MYNILFFVILNKLTVGIAFSSIEIVLVER